MRRPNRPSPSQSEVEFVDDISSSVLLTTPTHTRRLLHLISAFVLVFLGWATWAELDEVTVGSGKVIPSRQLQVVQNLEGGILKEVYIYEGQTVEPGQQLLRIDDTRFNADFRESEQHGASLLGESMRLHAVLESINISTESATPENWAEQIVLENRPLAFSETFEDKFAPIALRERAAYRAEITNIRSQLAVTASQISQKQQEQRELVSKISHLGEALKLGQEELALTEPLANEGVVSRVELLKIKRQVNQMKSELESSQLALPKAKLAVREAIAKHRELATRLYDKTQDELNEVESELAQLSEAQINLKDRVARTVVTSPVKGTVKTINIATVGGIIQPGMDLVEIVPIEDNLLIEAKILPKDIAFLRPGLEAVVKFTAYDFAIYGGLKGSLEHISADTIQDDDGNSFYLVRIRTEKNNLGSTEHPLPIIPGMLAQVDLMTGKKSVLDYLLKPILRARQQALRER